MPNLVICPLSRLATTAAASGAREMVTLLSNQNEMNRPAGILPERHLFLDMNDISIKVDGLQEPQTVHISRLIEFAGQWDRSAPLLVHCWMGISRSTAAAYIIAASLNPHNDEVVLAQELRKRSPSATPNARMIMLADRVLSRDGRMVEAIRDIGRGADAYEGEPFAFPLEV
ncbi:tyrosine phosphatase family protein [Hoeflea prorocentri]|uniref:Tyrosine phosphatase family protein n=1 Tax=Hoeflea prorocentri TaxID=1922333 RepID=A0A9X3ZHK8_9HYPH|nr:tyrosine phosphatase family protein [Hoeflea prorocentri]MCY6381449.1 tyrosine phosphatase family protein [Hoeflea prorocentri]MDA5399249.1 tyrosine phosphatase family protein [Hoeflea prorocentri]